MRGLAVRMETAAHEPVRADIRQSLGELGERIAARYLVESGARILDRNWRRMEGELDLVVHDADGVLVGVEVKTRRGLGFGPPIEAVTYAKQARLRRLIGLWLCDHDDVDAVDVRLDVIGVLIQPGEPVRLRHVTGIGS